MRRITIQVTPDQVKRFEKLKEVFPDLEWIDVFERGVNHHWEMKQRERAEES